MSSVLFIIGIVIGGIATLVTIIFTIISLAGGNNRNAGIWAAGFVVSLVILICSVFMMVKRIGQKIKNGIEWAEEHGNKSYDYDAVDYKHSDRQYFLDTLQLYIHEKHEGNVPVEFYINRAADTAPDGRLILPFLYPFSVKYDPQLFLGDIMIAANDTVYVHNVSQMAFDKNFVIAKVDNTNSKDLLKAGRGEIEYVFFDMRTGNYETFVNQEKMLEIAGKIGYVGSKDMKYLSDNYTGWIAYPEYD